MSGRVLVFVARGDAASLRLAGSCAVSAASMGARVDVFLFGPAVAAVVQGHDDPDDASSLLHQARTAGSCRLLGCSASVVEEKVDAASADRVLDAVIGWPTVIEWSRGVVDRFFF